MRLFDTLKCRKCGKEELHEFGSSRQDQWARDGKTNGLICPECLGELGATKPEDRLAWWTLHAQGRKAEP